MIICPRCETSNPPDAEECARCGRPLAIPPPRLLAQIQGLIPAEPIVSSGQLKPGTEASWEQAARVANQIETPPPPVPPSPATQAGPPPRWLAAGVFLAILFGFLFPSFASDLPPRRPGVETAFHLIDILPPGARVLLAWDYEPTTQGEMQLLAQPILQHLQQRQALVADVSLRPLGPGVAADARRLASAWRPPGVAAEGLPPVNLGFIPGNAAALQALVIAPTAAASLPGDSLTAMDMEDVLDAFDLIIEFSAESSASQQWIEQIAARQPVLLIVAASGAIAPVLEPYAQSGQLTALLAGYPDALAYESLLGQVGPATSQQTPQTLAHLLVILLSLAALARALRPHQL